MTSKSSNKIRRFKFNFLFASWALLQMVFVGESAWLVEKFSYKNELRILRRKLFYEW